MMAILERPRLLFTHNDAKTSYHAFDMFLGGDNIDFKESDYELDTETFLLNQHFDLVIIDTSHSKEKIDEFIRISKQQGVKIVLLFRTEPSSEIKEKYKKEGVDLTLSIAKVTLDMHTNPDKFSLQDMIYKLLGKKPSELQKEPQPIPAPKEYIIVVGDPLNNINKELYALFPDTFTFIFSEDNEDCKKKLQSYRVDLFLVYYYFPNPVQTEEDPKRISLSETTSVLERDDKKCLAIFGSSHNWYAFGEGENLLTFGADKVLSESSNIHEIQKTIYDMLDYSHPSGGSL